MTSTTEPLALPAAGLDADVHRGGPAALQGLGGRPRPALCRRRRTHRTSSRPALAGCSAARPTCAALAGRAGKSSAGGSEHDSESLCSREEMGSRASGGRRGSGARDRDGDYEELEVDPFDAAVEQLYEKRCGRAGRGRAGGGDGGQGRWCSRRLRPDWPPSSAAAAAAPPANLARAAAAGAGPPRASRRCLRWSPSWPPTATTTAPSGAAARRAAAPALAAHIAAARPGLLRVRTSRSALLAHCHGVLPAPPPAGRTR